MRGHRSVVILAFLLALATGCRGYPSPANNSGPGEPSDVPPAPSVQATAPETSPTRSGPAVQAEDTPAPSVAATGSCVVALVGQVHGTVTRAADDPNGPPIYVTVDYSGAPGERRRARNGEYALPLLARRCADGVHWVRFGISVVGFSQGVAPTGPDVRVDLKAGDVPSSVPPDIPDCVLVLGTLSGRIFVHGAPAADNTIVTSAGPPGATSITQETTTHGGVYSLPSPGLKCGTQPARSLIVAVQALGVVVPLTPETLDIQKDIRVP